jgi:hypothetical protein
VRRGTLLVLVAVAVAGACTRTRTLEASELNQRIATDMQAKKLADEGVVVSCPDDVPAEAGRTFDCTGTNPDGTTLTIEVTQTDDQGSVTYKVVGAG